MDEAFRRQEREVAPEGGIDTFPEAECDNSGLHSRAVIHELANGFG